MTGGRNHRRSRRSHAGAAAVGLLAAVLLFVGLKVLPFPADVLPLVLPGEFWSLLALVLLLGYFGYATMVRATPRPAARIRASDRLITAPPPEAARHADPVLPELDSGPEPSISVHSPARPAHPFAARADMEMSKLLEWIDGVSAQISRWSAGIGSHKEEEVAMEDTPPPVSVKHDPPRSLRAGAWTELRARTAIEKVLRKKPWTPATDIARTLNMDMGLAMRVTDSLREGALR